MDARSHSEESRERLEAERLVVLRTAVLSDAEHAVGNLLQKLHHAARVAGNGNGEAAERLGGTLTELERVLGLLFDYVTPTEVGVRPVAATSVLESLVSHVRDAGGDGVDVGDAPAGQVCADPRVLGRSFRLLSAALGDQWKLRTSVAADADEAGRIAFVVRSPGESEACSRADALALAVAQRLIELQGGELRHAEGADGGRECHVFLPVQEDVGERGGEGGDV